VNTINPFCFSQNSLFLFFYPVASFLYFLTFCRFSRFMICVNIMHESDRI